MSDSDNLFSSDSEEQKLPPAVSDERWVEMMQKHHDYYIGLKLAGKLNPRDSGHYELAMKREREGLVQPLRS